MKEQLQEELDYANKMLVEIRETHKEFEMAGMDFSPVRLYYWKGRISALEDVLKIMASND